MSRRTKGILFLILSAFFFNLMNIFVRMSGDIPSIQKSFFRNLIAAFASLIAIQRSGQGIHIKKENLPLFILRSLAGTMGILCNFYAVDHLLLANASILQKISPFMVVIFSFFILKEKIKTYHLITLAIAFAGCLCIVKPSAANLNLGDSMIGLMGGIVGGLAYTLVRKLSLRGERGPVIVLFFSTFSCLVVLPWVATHYRPMSLYQVMILLLAGLAAAGAQFAVTAAYSLAPASEISVYDYSQVLWAAITGFLIFGDLPDSISIIGYILIIGAALYMNFCNRKVKGETK